jgi:SAM-dependent methyltransferase
MVSMPITAFRARADLAELIDDPALPAADYAAAMADLARVNRLLLASRPTFAFLKRATEGRRVFSLLDVGSGHGDYLRAIAGWARRRGLEARLTGIDLSPAATAAARAATAGDLGIDFVTGDVFDYRPAEPPDLIVSALFTHHLPDALVERFLAWMERTARTGWHVNDLHRHPLAWAGFKALGAVMRWHPIVRHDGAVSVRRAFTRADWQARLTAAGVEAEIRWRPMFRYCVERLR